MAQAPTQNGLSTDLRSHLNRKKNPLNECHWSQVAIALEPELFVIQMEYYNYCLFYKKIISLFHTNSSGELEVCDTLVGTVERKAQSTEG